MVRDAFPLNGRVALLFQVGLVLGESLEPLGDLLAAGRQLLQRHDLLLIRLNEALQWPLQMLSLRVNTVPLFLALALWPSPSKVLLYLVTLCLPQGATIL